MPSESFLGGAKINLEVVFLITLIMEQTFFLLTTLIEFGDCVSDGHSLFMNRDEALEAFTTEIEECAENFIGDKGDVLIDLPTCREWRNEDGYGYTVTVEEVKPI